MDEFELLFEDWIKSYEGEPFTKDGIIDINNWNEIKPKILTVLKETNGFTGDLRTHFVDDWKKPKYFIWNTLAKWLYGIQNTTIDSFPSYNEAKSNVKTALFSSAILNLKKSEGTSESDMTEIEAYAKKDSSFIKKEIDLIKPDIILCGSTCDILEKILGITLSPVIEGDGVIYKDDQNNIYINFWHPAARYPGKLTYYSICSLYQRALREIK